MPRASPATADHKLRVPNRGAGAALPTAKGVRKHLNTSSAAAAALVDPDKPLTTQQEAFAKYWGQGESIGAAAIRAGFADDSVGYRMARMPNIRRVYDREKALFEEASQMSRKKVMDMLLDGFAMAKLMAEPASMVSAAREIGRMCGYYEPIKMKVDVNVKGEVLVRQFSGMSDADLLKFLTEGASSVPALAEPTPEAIGG